MSQTPTQPVAARPRAGRLDLVDVNRAGDVLERLLADVAQRQAELAEDRFAHRPRNADAARFGERLEPRRDIDPVAVSAGSVVDDVAEIDADAQQHPTLRGNVEVALRHDLLDGDGAFDRAHGARELRHDSVACDVYDSAAVLRDEREDRRLVRFEIAHRRFFVAPHEARIAGDIRGQDGREPTLVDTEALQRIGHGVFHATLALRAWKRPGRAWLTPYSGASSRLNGENYL